MSANGLGKFYIFALRAAADLTATVALPALFGAWAGKTLDNHFATRPLFFIVLLAFTGVATVVAVVRKARSYGKAYTALVDESRSGSARS